GGVDTSTILSGTGDQIAMFHAFGEPLGWHAARWLENSAAKHLFARLKEDGTLENLQNNIPSATAMQQLTGIAAIGTAYLPEDVDDVVIWQTLMASSLSEAGRVAMPWFGQVRRERKWSASAGRSMHAVKDSTRPPAACGATGNGS